MTETVTLAQVEALAAQLPLTERLQLVAHVCEQLSVVLPTLTTEATGKVTGTARGDESRASVATTRQARRSPQQVIRDLQLVHRRL